VRAVLERAPVAPPTGAPADVRVILDNAAARAGAAAAARRAGDVVRELSWTVTGAARAAGERIAHEAIAAARETAVPLCLLGGGETTVVVKGTGVGGRNQELALAAALVLEDSAGITIASVGTDGIDGPTDAAGAIVDGTTVARGRAAGRSAAADLDDNDSHAFFKAAGGLISTGPTGTNLMDVQLALVYPPG
jgi:glycerate-2-kinase